jgi:hypothetical protein
MCSSVLFFSLTGVNAAASISARKLSNGTTRAIISSMPKRRDGLSNALPWELVTALKTANPLSACEDAGRDRDSAIGAGHLQESEARAANAGCVGDVGRLHRESRR